MPPAEALPTPPLAHQTPPPPAATTTNRNHDPANDSPVSSWRCTFLESDSYRNRYRSWVLLVLALLIVSLTSGLIYGWPALRSRLIWEAATLASPQNTNSTSSTWNSNSTSTLTSFYTEDQLGLMYTFGSWSTQGGRFFVGLARDRFGTRLVATVSLAALVVGLFGIGAASTKVEEVDGQQQPSSSTIVLLTASLFCVGLGSGGQLCVQPVAGLFPHQTGIVLSSLSGAFQVSGLVFLLLTANQQVDRRLSFWIFGACILLLMVVAAILLPKGDSFLLQNESSSLSSDQGNRDAENGQQESQQDDKGNVNGNDELCLTKDQHGSVDDEENNGKGKNQVDQEELASASKSEVPSGGVSVTAPETIQESNNCHDNDAPPPNAWQQIKTSEYILLCMWFSIGIVPMQYYVGIIGYQLEELGDESGVYTDLFSYCFAAAAITAPLAGYIADQHGLGVAQGIATGMVAIPFFLLALKDSFPLGVQAVGLVAYGIGRMGIFGLYFTNCGRRFGYSNYGTLAGLGLLVSAIVSLLQYPLITWTVRGHSNLVNALSGVALVLQAPYFVWLHKREQLTSSAVSLGTTMPPAVTESGQGAEG